jgi:hypothetical protein
MDIFKFGSNGFMDGVGPGRERKASPGLRRRRRGNPAAMAVPAFALVAMAARRRRQKQRQASEIGPGTTDHDMKGVYTTGIDEIVGQASNGFMDGQSPSAMPDQPARREEYVHMREMPGKIGLFMPLQGEVGPIVSRLPWTNDLYAPGPGKLGSVFRKIPGKKGLFVRIPGVSYEDLEKQEIIRRALLQFSPSSPRSGKRRQASEIGPGTTDHDMKGVYTTGLDEIVGQARAARARRGVSPMVSPVPGLVARKPRVEIVDMPTMRITPGRVSPAMKSVSPQLAMLLRQINAGTQTLRADGAAVRRQRPVWPGGRGRYPY